MTPLSLAIVGSQYPNKRGPGRRFEMELCRPGESIELRPEPNHPADEHAIAVFSCRGVQLGYIPSVRAVFLGKLMREGAKVRAIFQGIGPSCGWCRVTFDGSDPVLPPAGKGKEQEPVFWPDGEWPDE